MEGIKKNQILVWIKEPDMKPKIEIIDNTLEELQYIVEGNIEAYAFSNDGCIICNEEGRIIGLEQNVELLGEDFVGTIMFVGVDEDNPDEFTDFPIKNEKGMRRMFPQLWRGLE